MVGARRDKWPNDPLVCSTTESNRKRQSEAYPEGDGVTIAVFTGGDDKTRLGHHHPPPVSRG